MAEKPKVYCFINGRWGSGDVVVMAVAEDGVVLGQHVSSSVEWAKADIGYRDTPMGRHKRAKFDEHYPGGWEVEWVDEGQEHAGLTAALERNNAAHEGELAS